MLAPTDRPLDPITVEVIRNKLNGIAEEMQSTLIKSSFSPFVKEGLDASASLFTIRGETLAQATAIPMHLATMIPMVKRFLSVFPLETMKPGDLYAMNEPYLGGTHLPDIFIMAPVFVGGKPIAFTAAITHHQDVGGMTPGSVPTNATDIFQEGLRIPPLKLREGGTFNETLLAMLRLNVRMPDMLIGDVNAQIASCTIGERRLQDLSKSYDVDLLMTVFDELLNRAETMTRQVLASLPDGTYSYTDYLDNDGVEFERPVKLSVSVTIAGDTMTCDFTESSPQIRGPFNCVPSGALAAGCFVICTLGGGAIPVNGGCFRPMTIKVKKGTVFDPIEPAAVNARTATLKRVTNSILSALRPIAANIIPADSAACIQMIALGGQRSDGTRYVIGQAMAGGSGAHRHGDGIDAIETDLSNTMNQPVEALELDTPVFVRTRRLRADSGGAGTWRGGLGLHIEYELLDGELTLTHRGERHYHPARGVDGGENGATAHSVVVRADGSQHVVRSKEIVRMKAGDVLVMDTAGGAGYGPAAARDPQHVLNDIRNGKVTRPEAEVTYGVRD